MFDTEADWEEADFGSLFSLNTPGFWGEDPGSNEPNVLVLRSTNFRKTGGLDYEAAAPRRFDQKKLVQKRLIPGDIILERSGGSPAQPVGRVNRFDNNGLYSASNFMQILRPNGRVDSHYVYYLLDDFYRRGGTKTLQKATTGIRNLDFQAYLQMPIRLPPLDEQRRIADVLRAVDDVIAANAQAVGQAVCLLRDLRFTLTGLDGSRPDWRHGPLLDFFQLQRGHDLPVQHRKEGPIPVIASNGQVGTHNIAAIPAPAVVTGRSGTIGRVTYFDGPCWPLNTTLFVRDYKRSNPRYVFHFLSAFPLTDYQSGTGVPTLNRNDVHAVEVPWPTSEEQSIIAASLDAVEQSLATMTAGLDQFRTLQVELSGDLLSGRVRVPA